MMGDDWDFEFGYDCPVCGAAMEPVECRSCHGEGCEACDGKGVHLECTALPHKPAETAK